MIITIKRVWTLPVTSYKNYSQFDVSAAPIKDHIFNKMKSQLKVIEARFTKAFDDLTFDHILLI